MQCGCRHARGSRRTEARADAPVAAEELRFGEWREIDLDAALRTVPAARIKRELREKPHGGPHLVPLSKQAVAALRELHPLTGYGKPVFRASGITTGR